MFDLGDRGIGCIAGGVGGGVQQGMGAGGDDVGRSGTHYADTTDGKIELGRWVGGCGCASGKGGQPSWPFFVCAWLVCKPVRACTETC